MTNQKFFKRILGWIEKVGNALPHPATLFLIFAVLVLLFSAVASWIDWTAVNPADGSLIRPKNLLTEEGLHSILTGMVRNFTDFAPLGIVLVAMLGIGIAEKSGLIDALIRLLVIATPKKLLTFTLVFAGIMSNVASDVGYVLLIPLAGIIFHSAGRHPLVGMAAAFAGVSGGFSANILLGTVDPLLAGLSTEAAQIMNSSYEVNPTANYYFMAVSSIVIALAGTWVTEKIIAPKFGEYKGNVKVEQVKTLTFREKKGLLITGMVALSVIGLTIGGLVPEDGFFRGPQYRLKPNTVKELKLSGLSYEAMYNLQNDVAGKNFKTFESFENALISSIGMAQYRANKELLIEKSKISDDGLLTSPLIKGVVAMLFITAGLLGLIYGFYTGRFKSDVEVIKGMEESMKLLALYLVLVFFASQFVAFFKSSNLGQIIAIKGANLIKSTGVGTIPLSILFILLAAFLNLFMGSASAKWALLAPIFVPMFMQLGYTPEFSQVVYRIGDSITNIVSPMMSFFALIIAFFAKYDKKAGIGSVIATMLPYTIAFFSVWTLLLIIWILFDLPLGPGAFVFLK